jgi:hypothetical protein
VPSREIRLGKDIARGQRIELDRNLSLGGYNLFGAACAGIEALEAFVLVLKREWIVRTGVHGKDRECCWREHYQKTGEWHYYACSFSGCPTLLKRVFCKLPIQAQREEKGRQCLHF